MRDLFLSDLRKEYSYQNLLEKVNQTGIYIPFYKGRNLFDFFTNLITALAYDLPITLLDHDFSENELDSLGIINVNHPHAILPRKHFSSLEELVERVRKSTASVTIFTSGTTGQPKSVTHSYSNLSRAVKKGAKFGNNIWGLAYNPTHMAGLQVFLQAFENMNPIINLFGETRKEVYQAIQDYKVTHISATPTFYRLLLPVTSECESVIRITFGGERSTEKLYNSVQLIFPNAKVTNIYASTEAGTLFASRGSDFQIPEEIREKIKVIDNELYIHNSLTGFSDNLKLQGEFYGSGDIIEWVNEDEKIFRIKNRKNELINIGGYKVNPLEVEDLIRNINGVSDVIVYGKSNSILGNILCADIVKEDNSSVTESAIRIFLTPLLQDFKIPRRIKFVDSLHITRTGKIKRT